MLLLLLLADGAAPPTHAFAKVPMTSLRRSTLVCNHLAQCPYHQFHQVFSDCNSLTVRSKAMTLCSKSTTLATAFAGGDLERLCGTQGGLASSRVLGEYIARAVGEADNGLR